MPKVMLDPGHGGYDPGAVGPSGVQEKNITLAVALQVADLLASAAEVRLTHKEDVPWDDNSDLSARSAMANEWGADCFVSIHCNSAADPEAHGTETFHYPGSGRGQALANSLQAKLTNALGLTDRGVKEANFAVLRQTNCPACLAEMAFISNSSEEALLESPDFQAKAARAIAEGVVDFLGMVLPAPAHAIDGVTIKAKGKTFPAILVDGRTYGPIRDIAEALGHKVTWFEEDKLVFIE